MKISIISDICADQILATHTSDYRGARGWRLPARFLKEINGIRLDQGVFTLASNPPVSSERIHREINHCGGRLNSVEASLSSRHLEAYVSARFRNEAERFIGIGVGASLAVSRKILQFDTSKIIKYYISGGKMETGDWYHTFRFHIVRDDEADWQDHSDLIEGDAVHPDVMDSYYVVVFAGM